MSWFSNMAERMARKEADKAQGFSSLVKLVAEGGKVSEDQAEAVLTENGKTVGDLQVAVASYMRRKAKLAEVSVELEQKLNGELLQARDGIRKISDQYEAAKRKFEDDTKRLESERIRLEVALKRIGQTRDELAMGCPYPALVEEWRSVRGNLMEAERQVRDVEIRLPHAREDKSKRAANLANFSPFFIGPTREELVEAKRLADAKVADMDRQRVELNAKCEKLRKQERDAFAKLLQP